MHIHIRSTRQTRIRAANPENFTYGHTATSPACKRVDVGAGGGQGNE